MPMNPAITCVALDLTTQCDRRCPDCCTGVGINRTLQHHPWEYFEQAAKVIYGVERVHLSGGEPTFHPQFAEFVPKFKELFGCKRLSMVTDGWGVKRHSEVIVDHIDEVHFTQYGNRRHEEQSLVSWSMFGLISLKIFYAGENMASFTPRSQIGGGKPCHRAWWLSGQVAYADGKLWGCCVAPGLDGAKGVEFVDFPMLGESREFLDVAIPPLPCKECFFSE